MDKLNIKEAIVVEGRDDTAVLNQVTDTLIIETHGFGIKKSTWELLQKAYNEKGLIILTDPDFSGEEIRRQLTAKFPNSKQAYMPRKKATKQGDRRQDIGIENASPKDVAEVLKKLAIVYDQASDSMKGGQVTRQDLEDTGLAGGPGARELREQVGEILGIGYGNANAFVKKLNGFGIGRDRYLEAVKEAKK